MVGLAVKQLVPVLSGVSQPNIGWYARFGVDTLPYVPNDEEERRAYRRRLGVNLGRIRTQFTSYTQEGIADRLGVDTETYARWERGSREPKAYDMHRIADEFGVPAQWLVEPSDSLTEIDRRLSQLRQAAAASAALAVAAEQGQPFGDETGTRPDTPPRCKRPRSPR